MTAVAACPVHVVGKRIVDGAGRTVYTDPGHQSIAHEIRCAGRTVWVMFHGGAAMSQEAYVVVRSGDGGRTWRLVASEPYFGVHAPFEFDSYSGPWTISGAQKAYFTGACPACSSGTVSLWVTLDGGATFRKYALPTIAGYRVIAIRVRGPDVTVTAKPVIHVGAAEKTVTVVVR